MASLFAPFIAGFPGNRHVVKNMIFWKDVVVVEWNFEAAHKGPFAGTAATGTAVNLPGCGVYQFDPVKRQVTAARIYFDVTTLLKQISSHQPRVLQNLLISWFASRADPQAGSASGYAVRIDPLVPGNGPMYQQFDLIMDDCGRQPMMCPWVHFRISFETRQLEGHRKSCRSYRTAREMV